MPRATVRGVEINYEVLGERRPWVALQPGGPRGLAGAVFTPLMTNRELLEPRKLEDQSNAG